MGSALVGVVWALTPPVVLLAIFWFILRGVTHADRHERAVYMRMEDEERARRGLPARAPLPVTRGDRSPGTTPAAPPADRPDPNG
jgi:hypothetical protein